MTKEIKKFDGIQSILIGQYMDKHKLLFPVLIEVIGKDVKVTCDGKNIPVNTFYNYQLIKLSRKHNVQKVLINDEATYTIFR